MLSRVEVVLDSHNKADRPLFPGHDLHLLQQTNQALKCHGVLPVLYVSSQAVNE